MSSHRMLIGFANGEGGVFKNWVKAASTGGGQTTGTPFPALITNDGYPIDGAVLTSNYFFILPIPQNIIASDDIVLKYRNVGSAVNGDVQIARGAPGFSNVVVSSGSVVGGTSFNLTVRGTDPRIVFRLPSPLPLQLTLNFLNGGTFSGMSDIVICKLSDEPSVDAIAIPDDVFYTPYVDFYTALKSRVQRPMGPANTNFNNTTRHSYRVPWRTGISYNIARWVPGAWAGTVSGTDTYTCGACPDLSVPIDGSTIQVQFTNANTGTSATLDYNGTGAKPIITSFGIATLSIGQIAANQLATLVFDSLSAGGGWLHFPGGLTASIPVEVRLALARRCGQDYWHNCPVMFDDASALAEMTYVRDNRALGQSIFWEFSNETWNPGFTQFHWLDSRGLALGFPSGDNRRMFGYVSLRFKQIVSQIVSMWGAQDGLRPTIAFQAFGASSSIQTYLLNSTDLNTSLGYAGYNAAVGVTYSTAPNRAVDVATDLSYATYIGGAQFLQFDAEYVNDHNAGRTFPVMTGAADDYASGDPTRMAAAFDALDNDLRQGLNSAGVLSSQTMKGFRLGSPTSVPIYSTWNTIATSYSPAKIVSCYEGSSCSVDKPSAATCTTIGISTSYGGVGGLVDNLIFAYKKDQRFYNLVIDQNLEFFALSQSQIAAWLLVPGSNPWGLLSSGNIYDASLRFQSYAAYIFLNDSNPNNDSSPNGVGGIIIAHSFTRKRWRELKAELEAKERSKILKKHDQRKTLIDARKAADAAIQDAELASRQQQEAIQADMKRMETALKAAASARSVATIIEQANKASQLAEAIKLKLEDDEEEEALAMLMLDS